MKVKCGDWGCRPNQDWSHINVKHIFKVPSANKDNPFLASFPRTPARGLEEHRGNMILVKLELWDLVMYLIIILGLPLTYTFATLRQSVAGNSTYRGIVFCILGTPKPVISNFVTTRQIETPYSSLCKNIWPTQQCSRWTKKRLSRKKVLFKTVLIPFSHTSYLMIAGFFWGGALTGPYPTLWLDGACGLGVGVLN